MPYNLKKFFLFIEHFANLSCRSMLSLPLEIANKHNTAKTGYAEAAAISNFSRRCVKGKKEKWFSAF